MSFSVYVHWPFCAAKCPYCDFNSHVRFNAPDQKRYVEGFKRELAYVYEQVGKQPLSSIFFGGGTPSLMLPETVASIIDEVTRLWTPVDDVEITLEANPTSVEAERFKGYALAGVNRVSMGIQALNDPDLKALGRLHSVKEAMAALDIARQNFKRHSFDLIYARPHQTLAQWENELTQALREGTTHLSLYQLTIEEGTPFYALHKAGKLIMPEEDLSRDFYDLTQNIMNAAGLPAYEISNHAKIGEESKHNLTYWRMGDYAGIGPGAHGRLTTKNGRIATVAEKAPEKWLMRVENAPHGYIEQENLSKSDIADEFLLMGLRLKEGISMQRFHELAVYPPDQTRLADLQKMGMIWMKDGRMGVTAEGFPVLDAVVADVACSSEINIT
jgi:putative oxygen-independent coproporphyrinogen III oxidase